MLRSDGSVICVTFLLAAVTAVPARGQTLTFEQVAGQRRANPRELDTEVLLAEAARAAAGGRSFALEAPTAFIKAGPRRAEQGDNEADVELEVELPLLADRAGRAELGARLGNARDVLQSAGGAIALADLAAAYAGAWLAQAQVELRQQDLDLTRAWLAAAELRVEAGADPPYESILVSGEHDRALLELLEARGEVELAWGELARLANVEGFARPLDLESLPGGKDPAAAASATGAAALAGIETRRDLTILIARANRMAASSRWAVAGDVGREGEEEIAHLGLAYRFPLGGERAAMEGELHAVESSAIAAATAEALSLRARVAAAKVALASTSLSLGADDFDRAVEALDSRVTEGKERASQVLPLRRQLLEASLAAAASRAARAQAAAELYFLDGGDSP